MLLDMAKLLFDLIAAQPEGTSPISGGGEYARRVFFRLCETMPSSVVVHAVSLKSRPLDASLRDRAAQAGIPLHEIDSIAEIPALLRSLSATRFFSALPLRYARFTPGWFPADCEFVYTVHGLRPVELPWDSHELRYATSPRAVGRHLVSRIGGNPYLSRRRAEFGRLFSLAARQRIVTVSGHSRGALTALYPRLRGIPIHTLYSPPAATPEAPGELPPQWGLAHRGYYLVITANRWGKNGARATDALLRLYQSGTIDRPTVVVGAKTAGKLVPYLRRLVAGPFGDRFRTMDYVSRPELVALYRSAYALVFPTLNEGFGYPPLECMAQGTPVISSGINSVPELVGDAALLCNPWSVMEIASRIAQLETDPELYHFLTQRGPARAREVGHRQWRMLDDLIDLVVS
jgi:glycosyltransferase involved in cell wall biosynthesis